MKADTAAAGRADIAGSMKIPARIFLVTLFLQVVTGFGQMPIFKRYYIADIPGLGWLDAFYTTLFVHYCGALLLLCLGAYMATEYLLEKRRLFRPTGTGGFRIFLLTGTVVSGVLLGMKNFGFFWPDPGVIVFLNLVHLGLVMAFLMSGLFAVVFRKRWFKRG